MAKCRKYACAIVHTLRAQECSALAVTSLDRHLTIPINGNLTQKTLFQGLIGMAVNRLSIHSLRKVATNVPCETSFRYHLSKVALPTLERINFQILLSVAGQLLKKGHKYQFAIDLTNDPYYGDTDETNEDYILRGKQKKSTTRFYSYLSLYTIHKGERLTFAVFPVKQGVPMVESLRRCLAIIQDLGVETEVLCLDRGFYAYDVFSLLQDEGIPHIMPVKKQGNEMLALLEGNRARYATYTMKRNGRPLDLNIAIDVHYLQGKNGEYGNVNLGYVVHGIDWKPRKVYNVYRTRFAIEASYRIRNTVKGKTSTRNVAIRYLYAIIALMLKNIWVFLQWRYFSPMKRGPRTIDEDRFRFDQFRMFVREGLRRVLRPRTEIPVLRSSG
ncbi:MAG: hypothetical protein PWP08_733 [Methanofollis sp.]|nr:hypothetical protein [Methanofollis sp.]